MSIKATGSSTEKGESLKDTALTLDAYDPDIVVIRHRVASARRMSLPAYVDAHVVNAGDGKHQHPTQALLDLHTIDEEFGGDRRSSRRDRRRRPSLTRRTLEHPGARAHGRAGHARGAA